MMKYLVSGVLALIVATASAITATKEYVDRKDATNAAAIAVIDGVVQNHTERLQDIDLRFETTPTLDDISQLNDMVLDVRTGVTSNAAAIAGLATNVYSEITSATNDIRSVLGDVIAESTNELASTINTQLSTLSNNLDQVIANATPGDYENVSNRAMTALQAHQSLAPATNYTDIATNELASTLNTQLSTLSNNLDQVIANATPGDYENVSNRAMTALQSHQSLAPATNYTDSAINRLSSTINTQLSPVFDGGGWIVSSWTYDDEAAVTIVDQPTFSGGKWSFALRQTSVDNPSVHYDQSFEISATEDAETLLTFMNDEITSDAITVILAKSSGTIIGYTIGDQTNKVLAATSITNGLVTQAELEGALEDLPIPEVDTSRLATKQELNAVSNEAQIVYRLFSGSNVVCEVTNYNSVAHAPELRLLQLNESNEYFTVWTETNGLAIVSNNLATSCALAFTQALEIVESNYAPRAWSRTTSGLGADAPSNTTWISTPTTVIAGGLEYAKVVHASGAVWVLSGNGMLDVGPTTNSYMRVSADDGTEIMSIEKTDAVTVGAYADGITVQGGTVTIPVPVVSAAHPTMFWRTSLTSGDWADESEYSSGSVTWSGSSGAWVCTVTVGNQASMFFKFSYLMPGATLIRNSAPTELAGGILISNQIYQAADLLGGAGDVNLITYIFTNSVLPIVTDTIVSNVADDVVYTVTNTVPMATTNTVVSVSTNTILPGAGIKFTYNGGDAITISRSQSDEDEPCSVNVITAVRYNETNHCLQIKSQAITFRGEVSAETGWRNVFEAVSHASEHQE